MVQNIKKKPSYSLVQESISLNPDFPISMISYSCTHDPISSLHNHNVLEIGICRRGNGIFVIDNSIATYEMGDIITIGPGFYHRAKSGSGMDDLWSFFFFDLSAWNLPETLNNYHCLIPQSVDSELTDLMNILTNEFLDKHDGYKESIKGLLNTIAVRLTRYVKTSYRQQVHNNEAKKVILDERISRAMDIMISSTNNQYTITELAESCYLSVSHFRQLFKKQIGMSPKHFQTKIKINMAMNMLKDRKQRVIDISCDCGFESLSSFNRQFKKETGISPLQWRLSQ